MADFKSHIHTDTVDTRCKVDFYPRQKCSYNRLILSIVIMIHTSLSHSIQNTVFWDKCVVWWYYCVPDVVILPTEPQNGDVVSFDSNFLFILACRQICPFCVSPTRLRSVPSTLSNVNLTKGRRRRRRRKLSRIIFASVTHVAKSGSLSVCLSVFRGSRIWKKTWEGKVGLITVPTG